MKKPDKENILAAGMWLACIFTWRQPRFRAGNYAKAAHDVCGDVPLGLHAHQFHHGKASHWLEDGMNIIQILFLLGHEQLQTTMVYLNITAEEKAKALATLEDENDKKISAKWKNPDGSLADFCGIRKK